MPPCSRSATRVLVVSLALLIAGCGGPTYKKEQLAESLHGVLVEDGVDAMVRLIDRTIAVQLEVPKALARGSDDTQLDLGPGLEATLLKVQTGLHRVLLSTDADIRFYLVLISDPEIPGAYLTLIRYLEDIRKAQANMIGVTELWSRTIFELNLVEAGNPLTIAQYPSREIQLSDFLTWQLTQRIQQELAQMLTQRGVATVGRCQGQFADGEFAFILNVTPTRNGGIEEETMRVAFERAAQVTARVLSSYQFDSFNAVRLIHPMSGRNLVLPRASLDVFRR